MGAVPLSPTRAVTRYAVFARKTSWFCLWRVSTVHLWEFAFHAGAAKPVRLLKIPIGTLCVQLDTTKARCAEIGERYPRFERSYRRRRRSLAQSALTLAGARLLSLCRRVLGTDAGDFATDSRRAALVFRATSLGVSCRVLRFVLVVISTEQLRWLDDATMRSVLAVIRSVHKIGNKLDVEVSSIEAQRKRWDRVEAFGKTG